MVEQARGAGLLVISLDTPFEPADVADATFATDNFKASVRESPWRALPSRNGAAAPMTNGIHRESPTMTAADRIPAEALPRIIAERALGKDRYIVALAGPPGAEKSTLADSLAEKLNTGTNAPAMVVPMDGFHFDNAVLEARGLRSRKGAPETFDVAGLAALLDRLADPLSEVAIPLFDRGRDLARAGAAIVTCLHSILIVEGNYLLLDEAPWKTLARHFDLTISLDVPFDELERRLLRRSLKHGRAGDEARSWVQLNDLPNAHRVVSQSRPADFTVAAPRETELTA